MMLFRPIRPARLLASALLLGGIAVPQAYAQETPGHPRAAQPGAMPLLPVILPQNSDSRFAPKTAPKGNDTGTVEGPSPKSAAGGPDRVILPNLKGLVFIDNIKALQHGVVSGNGVVTHDLPFLDEPAIHDQLAAFVGKPLTQASVRDLGARQADQRRLRRRHIGFERSLLHQDCVARLGRRLH